MSQREKHELVVMLSGKKMSYLLVLNMKLITLDTCKYMHTEFGMFVFVRIICWEIDF